MPLRAKRGNPTEAGPLCIACDCFVVPPRNDIKYYFVIPKSNIRNPKLILPLPSARALRSYCTGVNHGPVSPSIPNAACPNLDLKDFIDFGISQSD